MFDIASKHPAGTTVKCCGGAAQPDAPAALSASAWLDTRRGVWMLLISAVATIVLSLLRYLFRR
jgi:hypothetical protein